MKIRCDLNINEGRRRLVLSPKEQEKDETIALKLSAYLLFWDMDPQFELSSKEPALQGQPFFPDLAKIDETGALTLWVECGKVALYKLDKISRRYPHAKIVVLKPNEVEGRRLRADMEREVERGEKVEVWSWPAEDFKAFKQALTDDIHVVGEAGERSLNLVVNETPLYTELIKL